MYRFLNSIIYNRPPPPPNKKSKDLLCKEISVPLGRRERNMFQLGVDLLWF